MEKVDSSLFAPVDVIPPVPEISLPFRAEDTFFGEGEVRIIYRGDNFINWFGNKVEESVPAEDPVPLDLKRIASDQEIIAGLGGEEAAETGLAEIWRLLLRQPNGEQGRLLTNGFANLFLVRDINGNPRLADVRWCDVGWYVYAHAVGDRRWCGGGRVFFRKPQS